MMGKREGIGRGRMGKRERERERGGKKIRRCNIFL